jgi:hypothetical protein
MRVGSWAAIAAGVLVAGCQADGGPRPVASTPGATAIAAPPPVAFECPAAGTRVTFNDGTALTHAGADPADPAVCRGTTRGGQQLRLLYNFYTLPTVGEAELRRGFGALWPLAPGGSSNFMFVGQTTDGNTFQFAESWRVERAERITVAGAPRDAIVLRRTQQGQGANNHLSHQTYWYDVATRTWLRRDVELVRGTTAARSYQATALGRN